ncbi:MAG: TrmB family transcriptional regulator [Gemmatimonadales bacterium]
MLERFGFTPTETKSYQTLLKIGPSTGYGVARELGIARANVYQALEALVRRGAARKAATIPSQYAAVSPAALLAELERGFRRDLVQLDESLRRLPQGQSEAVSDLEVLAASDRLIARTIAVVDGATAEVLAVFGPWAGGLGAALEAARARGALIRAVSLGPSELEGIVVRSVGEAELLSYWGGLPIAVVADRARTVFGVLVGDEAASGFATGAAGAVPFLRHLLRREMASGA